MGRKVIIEIDLDHDSFVAPETYKGASRERFVATSLGAALDRLALNIKRQAEVTDLVVYAGQGWGSRRHGKVSSDTVGTVTVVDE